MYIYLTRIKKFKEFPEYSKKSREFLGIIPKISREFFYIPERELAQ